VSLPDTDLPPVGEEIHLPGPSLQPLLLAFGLMLSIVGITLGIVPLVAGVVLSVWVIVRWIGDTRRQMAELPEDLGEH
jgi:hypothetical protein